MNEQNEIQKVNGTWNGIPCSIKKVWGKNTHWEGHEFSADECTKLFNDEIIEFDAISKSGKPYTAKGKLEQQSFTDKDGYEHQYVGFALKFDDNNADKFNGIWNNKNINVKKAWGEHEFTKEEQEKLLAGETIEFEAVSKNTGNKYKARGKLAEQTYEGKTYVGFKPEFS